MRLSISLLLIGFLSISAIAAERPELSNAATSDVGQTSETSNLVTQSMGLVQWVEQSKRPNAQFARIVRMTNERPAQRLFIVNLDQADKNLIHPFDNPVVYPGDRIDLYETLPKSRFTVLPLVEKVLVKTNGGQYTPPTDDEILRTFDKYHRTQKQSKSASTAPTAKIRKELIADYVTPSPFLSRIKDSRIRHRHYKITAKFDHLSQQQRTEAGVRLTEVFYVDQESIQL